MLSEQNPLMQKANTTMNDFYANEQERAMYKAACHYESDRVSMINESMRKGIEQGFSQGIQQGISQGIQQTIINMRKENCNIEFISKITRLSIEGIKRL